MRTPALLLLLLLLLGAAGATSAPGASAGLAGTPIDAASLLQAAVSRDGLAPAMTTSAQDALINRVADTIRELDPKQQEQFWIQMRNAALGSSGRHNSSWYVDNRWGDTNHAEATAAADSTMPRAATPSFRRRPRRPRRSGSVLLAREPAQLTTGANAADSGGTDPDHVHRRREQVSVERAMQSGWCLAGENDTVAPVRDKGTFRLEVDEASDLSLLVAHVISTLIQDRMGFVVDLVVKHHLNHSIEQVAFGAVDASVEIQLTETRDLTTYEQLVEVDELAIDMGPTGYSNRAGWYLANGHLVADEQACMHADYWHTLARPAALDMLLNANEVEPGRDEYGRPVCDVRFGDRGFCPPGTGKFFSRACTASGYSVTDQGRPCKALLAHYPSYDEGANEQLINNLGEAGLEFGIVWLGANASNEILARAAAGEVFLFHHWYPSPLLAAGNFTQVFLPTHNPHQWNDERRDVNGSIASEFAPATIRKLFNAQKSEQYEELHVFLSKFELHTYHLDELLERAVGLGRNHNCIGADETLECRAVDEIVACDWLQAHPYVWDNFIPSHAHCEYGEHVQIVSDGEEAICVPCEAGRFQDRRSNLKACQACAPGTYQNRTGQIRCIECAAGKYHNYSSASPSVNASDCLDCQPGKYQDADSQTKCWLCEPGKYQPLPGKLFCSACQTGDYQNETGQTECLKCEANARNCRITMQNGHPHEECPTAQWNKSEACHCQPGHFRDSVNSCKPCPEGAYCCMCKEVAGCYDPAYGPCNFTQLHYNMRTYNSTCPNKADGSSGCYSGSPIPMAMPGHYAHNYSATGQSGGTVFLACDLQVATTKMRTRVDWEYFGCRGGPSSMLGGTPCASDNPQAFLCSGPRCGDGFYVASTGLCAKCDDALFSRTLMLSILTVGFLVGIPLVFTVIFFSVSDKSASQNMVYPRLIVDLATVLYLLRKSTFQYWPVGIFQQVDELSGLNTGIKLSRNKQGASFLERHFNNVFFECAFGWNFFERYVAYLLLPVILMCGLSLQVGVVYFLYKYNDGDSVEVSGKGQYSDEEDDDDDVRFSATQQTVKRDSSCLNRCARALVKKFPNGSTPRGGRIAWAIPQGPEEVKRKGWKRFWNHAVQVYLLLIILLYITLVNYSLTVFDCSQANIEAGVIIDSTLGEVTYTGNEYSYMESNPTVACFTFDDPQWIKLAAVGGLATVIYTISIPATLLTIFVRNRESALRGDMSYMQRYGFLLKPYRQECYYWEIVNIARKALLSCLVRMLTSQPFLSGTCCAVVLFLIIYHQAEVRPYKYAKHNDCAIYILWVACLNFLSSLIFISELPSAQVKGSFMIFNIILLVIGFVWAICGAIKDNFNFVNYLLFTSKCEASGRAQMEKEELWLQADKPGLVRLQFYDLVVLRSRYAHVTLRTKRKSASSPIGSTWSDFNPVAANEEDVKTIEMLVEGKPVEMICIEDNRDQAIENWQKFHKHFAKFVRQVEPDRIDGRFVEEMNAIDQIFSDIDQDNSGSLDKEEVKRMFNAKNMQLTEAQLDRAFKEMTGDDDENGCVTLPQFEEWYRASQEGKDMERDKQEAGLKRAKVEKGSTHLSYLAACRMLMEELYDARTLAYMALYLEYVIKHDLRGHYGLDEAGPSDICSQILQFGKIYATDLLTKRRVKKVAAAVSLTTHSDIGGWNQMHEEQPTSPQKGVVAAKDSDKPKRNPLELWCNPLLRPYRLIGLDIGDIIRTMDAAVQRFDADDKEEEIGFANPMMALSHSVQTGQDDFAFVGAIQ